MDDFFPILFVHLIFRNVFRLPVTLAKTTKMSPWPVSEDSVQDRRSTSSTRKNAAGFTACIKTALARTSRLLTSMVFRNTGWRSMPRKARNTSRAASAPSSLPPIASGTSTRRVSTFTSSAVRSAASSFRRTPCYRPT